MRQVVILSMSLVLLLESAVVLGQSSQQICACLKKTGTIRIVDCAATCAAGEQSLSWNTQGPRGPAGPAGPGLAWQLVTTDTQAQSNTGYVTDGSAPVQIVLPPIPTVGDVVRVSAGSVGWKIVPNIDQLIMVAGTKCVVMPQTPGWTPQESNRSWQAVASSADGSRLVAAVYGGQIYTSSDYGVNWTAHESNRNWRAVASSADGSRLVAAVYGGQIYTSSDYGVNWTPHESDRYWMSVASSAQGSLLVAAGRYMQIYTSSDYGETWTPRESSRTWHAVASSAYGRLVAVVYGGQIYTSSDYGETWTPHESNRSWQSVASSADGSRLVAADYTGQIYTSSDYGETWTPHEIDNVFVWVSVASSADGSRLVAVAFGGRIYTWPAPSGWLTASSDAAIELLYIGDGRFRVLSCVGTILGTEAGP